MMNTSDKRLAHDDATDKSTTRNNESQSSSGKGSKGCKYPLPDGFGFDSICCPHYTAEIIIYLCLWMIDVSNLTAALVALWVITNLSVVADLQFQWYHEHYGHVLKVKRKHWKRLVPGWW